MRKTAAILLIGLVIFNWVGYKLYIALAQNQADRQMVASLDNNTYSEEELISIKFPIEHLSYNISNSEFERVDGKIEINGQEYNYVKRRLINDSLELLCIPNKKSTALNTARDEFFRLVNGLQQNGHSQKANDHSDAFKAFNIKYCSANESFAFQAPLQFSTASEDRYLLRLTTGDLAADIHPPDLFS
jgi:hypothetical protein